MKLSRLLRLPFLRPATRAFIVEADRAEHYSLFELLHGLVYGRFTYLYISLGLGEHPLAKAVVRPFNRLTRPARHLWRRLRPVRRSPARPSRWSHASGTFTDGYHGKVLPLDAARRLVTVREDIRLPDLEQVIPYPRARALILHNPDHIALLDCPCRASRPNPCLPLDVCLIVGEPFVSMVLDTHPTRARRITPAQAERVLAETDARGNVHHAFFKDAMLGRFYAICNCCDCCCGAMQTHRHGQPMLAASGYVCEADDALCIGCGECAERCQFHALTLPDGFCRIDAAACMGCGVCVNACPQEALTLVRDPAKGIPLELHALTGI